ncbi:ATP-dependent RNA helicase DDX51-like [Rhopilema esculentum]|uniref:ATP-dependent RNA helicase DDX51-like n=1 Tax=Rhopilema esculentum TaxID=499914 RepID=UPI0031D0B809
MLPKWIAQPKEIFSQKTNEQVSVKECTYLKEFSKKNLELLRINHLFPVQSNVIPYILSQNCKGSIFGKAGLQPSDICVSAPTGSGKTLAYAVPIVQVIHHCLFRRLQALVVLPSKDLASQVKTVFSKLVAGTHLKIGLASGVKSFHDEQQLLVSVGQHGFVSNVDILVSTPGRLVDHITSTDGFSLQHIRFLVIDEADRLLGQSYHNWLEKIFEAIFTPSTFDSSNKSTLLEGRCGRGHLVASSIDRNELPLQKLLFSATMTQNPEKLGPLNLYNPVFFKVMGKAEIEGKDTSKGSEETERYTLPELLEEKMTICKPGEKPLLVVYFVKVLNYRRILCFTGSIEATHRLFLLLKAFDIKASEFSSSLNQTQRKGTLRDFKMGKIDLLVCSDAMSRGMDIEDVDFVISYDPPVNMKTYIHRVGRTARAGNRGTALTLLSSKEVFHFKKMAMDSSRKSSVQKLVVPKNDLEPLMADYQNALASLKDLVKTENQQKS